MDLRRILYMMEIGLLVTALLAAKAFGSEPKADLTEKEYNFGTALQGDVLTHTFILKNMGDGNLIINKVETSPEFLTIRAPKSIASASTAEFSVVIDTSKQIGDVQGDVSMETNDTSNPVLRIHIRGQVDPVIGVRPMGAAFFSVYKGQSGEETLTIHNHYSQPIRITKVESKSNRFTAHIETVTEGKEYRLHIRVNPDAAAGRTMEKLTLFTDSPRKRSVDVGVNIFVKNDVYNFPDRVDFGVIRLDDLKKNPSLLNLLMQTVLVKRREGKGTDFQIKLEHNIPFISIKQEPERGSETYRLDISLVVEKMTKGKIDTFIRVLTNDQEVPEIKIPVTGEIT